MRRGVFSIVSDYIRKPIAAYNSVGNLVWDVEYDIYGNIRSQSKGNKDFIPFRNQGQYEDSELNGLMYNRFRYYDGNSGTYISQDPIRLSSGDPNFYSYVKDSNSWVDTLGLYSSGLLGVLTKLAKQISEGNESTHFFAKVMRTVAVGQDSKGNLFAASSNGLEPGQVEVARSLGVTPLNTSTMEVNGKNLHAEEVLLRQVSDLEAVGTWKRLPCGDTEHNCMQQLIDADIKIECSR